jgi:peptidyl-prolyl cis-trans isomerase SurA
MTKFQIRLLPGGVSLALIAFALLSLIAATPASAQIVAMVNGDPITNLDIEQRIKLNALSQKQITRQQALEELIEDKVKVKEAKRYGLDLSASDIDSAFANMGQRMGMNAEQLTKSLEGRGIRPETLKARIRADGTWQQLVRGRYPQSLMVGEKDIIAVVGKKDEAQGENFEYQLRTIILVVPRGAGAGVMESRRKEAEAYRARIQSCDEADRTFRSMSTAAIRAQITKTSGDLPAALRATLDKTPIGQLTAPEVTKAGIEMVALCGKKASTADTPAQREARDKIYAQKFEAKATQYLKEARRTMMIEYRNDGAAPRSNPR